MFGVTSSHKAHPFSDHYIAIEFPLKIDLPFSSLRGKNRSYFPLIS